MRKANPVIFAAALLLPLAAIAQTPPTHIDNVWNSRSHQPTEAEVGEREAAAGDRLNQAERQENADELQQLDRDILERAQQGMNDGVMSGDAATEPTR